MHYYIFNNEIEFYMKQTLKKSSFYNSPPNYPLLFLWIKKLKGALVSKYSLYFNELLVKNSNSSFDIKSYCSKLPVDYFGKMLSFQKKSDALCVCIIFDAKDTKYHPNGYNCIGKEVRLPTGLETFPAVLSIPTVWILHRLFLYLLEHCFSFLKMKYDVTETYHSLAKCCNDH